MKSFNAITAKALTSEEMDDTSALISVLKEIEDHAKKKIADRIMLRYASSDKRVSRYVVSQLEEREDLQLN